MNYIQLLKSRKGVTLIELLVVVVILGLIAAVVIPMVMDNQEDAYLNTTNQNRNILQDAVNRYLINGGSLDDIDLAEDNGMDEDYAGTDPLVPNYVSEIPVPRNGDGDVITWTLSSSGVVGTQE